MKKNDNGVLIVFSGPSGSGKGTVLGEYFKGHPEAAFSVSATTRKPRPGEIDGTSYHFVSRERFEEMIREGEVLEYAQQSFSQHFVDFLKLHPLPDQEPGE